MFDKLLQKLGRTPRDLGTNARVRPARDVLMAERDGVAVLLDLRHAVYLGLDEVGTLAWREIENGASADAVAQRVCDEYDAPLPAVREDMKQFVADLRRRRLVVRA